MFLQYTGIWNSGGVAAFHPKNVTGALAIWEAEVNAENFGGSAPSDGQEIYSWVDQTANAYDAARVTAGPLYETTSLINTGPAFRYNGTTQHLVVTGTDSSPILPATGDFHMFFVLAYSGGSSTSCVMSQGDVIAANNGFLQVTHRYVGGTLRTNLTHRTDGTFSNVSLNNDLVIASSSPILIEVKRVGADYTIIADGNSTSTSGNASHVVQQDGTVLGGSGGPWGSTYGQFWQGDLAAVYIYSGEKTGTDYTDIINYITTNWGV